MKHIFYLLLFFSSSVFSSTEEIALEMGQLQSEFQQGVRPDSEELVGWHSGRCFNNSKDEQFYGLLLIGLEERLDSESTDASLHYLFTMTNMGGAHDAFDQLSPYVTWLVESSINEDLVAELKHVKSTEDAIIGGLKSNADFEESFFTVKKVDEQFLVYGKQGDFEEWCYTTQRLR